MPSTLTRWDPFGELIELRSRLDRAFDDPTDGRERDRTLAIDVESDNGNLVIRAEVPGIKPEEVKIEVQDDILTVYGKHEQETEQKHKHYVRRERRYGSFSRSIVLPAGVDAKQDRRHDQGRRRRGDDPAQGGAQGHHHDHAARRLTDSL
jgi:HSP20 family protein